MGTNRGNATDQNGNVIRAPQTPLPENDLWKSEGKAPVAPEEADVAFNRENGTPTPKDRAEQAGNNLASDLLGRLGVKWSPPNTVPPATSASAPTNFPENPIRSVRPEQLVSVNSFYSGLGVTGSTPATSSPPATNRTPGKSSNYR